MLYGWIGIIVYITSALAITFTLAAAIHFINHAHATAPTKVQA